MTTHGTGRRVGGRGKGELTGDQLLAVQSLMVQLAPEGIAELVLPPDRRGEAVFLLAALGQRLNGAQDAMGLLVAPQHLGRLAGLAETRLEQVGGTGLLAPYIAAKDQAGRSARELPPQAERMGEPQSPEEYTARVAADVEAQREVAAESATAVGKTLADGDQAGALRDAYEQMFRMSQDDPRRLATLTVAALLMLAETR